MNKFSKISFSRFVSTLSCFLFHSKRPSPQMNEFLVDSDLGMDDESPSVPHSIHTNIPSRVIFLLAVIASILPMSSNAEVFIGVVKRIVIAMVCLALVPFLKAKDLAVHVLEVAFAVAEPYLSNRAESLSVIVPVGIPLEFGKLFESVWAYLGKLTLGQRNETIFRGGHARSSSACRRIAGCVNIRPPHYIATAVIFLATFLSSFAHAQTAALQGFCDLGGVSANVSGLLSINKLQGVIPSCTVTVYLTGTQTLATIYSDAGSDPLSNPFTANSTSTVAPGQWTFWAAINQGYDIRLSGGVAPNVYPSPVTLTDRYPGFEFSGVGAPYPPAGVPVSTGSAWSTSLGTIGGGPNLPTISSALPNYVLPEDNGGDHQWQGSGLGVIPFSATQTQAQTAINTQNQYILPGGGPYWQRYPFSVTYIGDSFNRPFDLRTDSPAHNVSVTEVGAVCNANYQTAGQVTTTSGSNQVSVVSEGGTFKGFVPGETLVVVGTVSGVPTAWEPIIVSFNSGTNVITTYDNAPFTATSATATWGFDDTTAIQSTFSNGLGAAAQVTIPSFAACLTHTLATNVYGLDLSGLSQNGSMLLGYPGEDVLDVEDSNNPVFVHNLTLEADDRIDATKAWNQIVTYRSSCNSTYTSCTVTTVNHSPTDRHYARQSVHSNNPVAPPWCVTATPSVSLCTSAVAAVTTGSPTITVATGENAPAVGATVVFPYLTPAFKSTVASVIGQNVTLSANYPGTTSSQQEFIAGATFQTLGASIGTSNTSLTLAMDTSINKWGVQYQLGSDGAVQIDSEIIGYHLVTAGAAGAGTLYSLTRGEFGTTAAAHTVGALVVPLNPFVPTRPYPINPTVNAGGTTPANAEYYPAFNVGNVALALVGQPGNDSKITDITLESLTGAGNTGTTAYYQSSIPYDLLLGPINADFAFDNGLIQSLAFQNGALGNEFPDAEAKINGPMSFRANAGTAVWMELGDQGDAFKWDVYNDTSGMTFETGCEQYDWTNLPSANGIPLQVLPWMDFNFGYTETLVGGSGPWEPLQVCGVRGFGLSLNTRGSVFFSGSLMDFHQGAATSATAANPTVLYGSGNQGVLAIYGASNATNILSSSTFLNFGYSNSVAGCNPSGGGDQQCMGMSNSGQVNFAAKGTQNGDALLTGNVTPSTWYKNANQGIIEPSEFSELAEENGAFNPVVTDISSPWSQYVSCAGASPLCQSTAFDPQPSSAGIQILSGGRATPQIYTVYALYKSSGTGATESLHLYTTPAINSSPVLTTIATLTVSPTATWQVAEFDNVDLTADSGLYFGFGAGTFSDSSQTYYIGGLMLVPQSQKLIARAINMPTLPSKSCIGTDANGNFQAGTCSGGSGTVNSGTLGHIGYYAATGTAISSDANLDDGATAANTLTYSGTGGISAPKITATGTGAQIAAPETTAPTGVASSDLMWADSTAHRFKFNPNNAGALNFVGIAAAGTSGDCVKLGTNGIDILDSGSPCGGAGTIGGSIAANQVPVGTAANTIGASDFTDNTSTSAATGMTGTTQAWTYGIGATTNTHSGMFTIDLNNTPASGSGFQIVDQFGTKFFVYDDATNGAVVGLPTIKSVNGISSVGQPGIALASGAILKTAQTASLAATQLISTTTIGNADGNNSVWVVNCYVNATAVTSSPTLTISLAFTDNQGAKTFTSAAVTLSTTAPALVAPMVLGLLQNTAPVNISTTLTGTATYDLACKAVLE